MRAFFLSLANGAGDLCYFLMPAWRPRRFLRRDLFTRVVRIDIAQRQHDTLTHLSEQERMIEHSDITDASAPSLTSWRSSDLLRATVLIVGALVALWMIRQAITVVLAMFLA